MRIGTRARRYPLNTAPTERPERPHPFDVAQVRRWPRAPYVERGLPWALGSGRDVRSLRSDGAVASDESESTHSRDHVPATPTAGEDRRL
jgi:hypothetical protein